MIALRQREIPHLQRHLASLRESNRMPSSPGRLGDEEQVLGITTFACTETNGSQGVVGHGLCGFGLFAGADEKLGNSRGDLACSDSERFLLQQPLLLKSEPDRSLPALTGDAGAAESAELAILG